MNTPAPLNDPAESPPTESPKKDQAAPASQADAETEPQTEAQPEPPKICLDQFLKTCGVETGGQAKRMIQGGEILLNNKVETRRRKKLVPGDEVQLYDDIFVVALAEPDEADVTEAESTETEAAEVTEAEPTETEPTEISEPEPTTPEASGAE